jgi:hypothetical protein
MNSTGNGNLMMMEPIHNAQRDAEAGPSSRPDTLPNSLSKCSTTYTMPNVPTSIHNDADSSCSHSVSNLKQMFFSKMFNCFSIRHVQSTTTSLPNSTTNQTTCEWVNETAASTISKTPIYTAPLVTHNTPSSNLEMNANPTACCTGAEPAPNMANTPDAEKLKGPSHPLVEEGSSTSAKKDGKKRDKKSIKKSSRQSKKRKAPQTPSITHRPVTRSVTKESAARLCTEGSEVPPSTPTNLPNSTKKTVIPPTPARPVKNQDVNFPHGLPVATSTPIPAQQASTTV